MILKEISPRVFLFFSLFNSLLFGSHSILLNRDQLKQWYPDYLTRSHFTLTKRAIDDISADTFAELAQIKFINLSENMVSSLDPLVFKDLIQIETIYINQNNLKNLNRAIFSGLSQLKALALNSNKLTLVTKSLFSEKNLTKLETLSLTNNLKKIVFKKRPSPAQKAGSSGV
jgi:Leucine-rich repeat (LRR) protein